MGVGKACLESECIMVVLSQNPSRIGKAGVGDLENENPSLCPTSGCFYRPSMLPAAVKLTLRESAAYAGRKPWGKHTKSCSQAWMGGCKRPPLYPGARMSHSEC